ncbi:VWA domain-containing protein [Nioella sp. MMSF_3534]|uniref:VWA domain-containing protein n=1 Tax=Nioella sp. MMSF_3534 TaxID=3046720 RepID=UPI00273FE15A|nr:VWA domain-containing protein [Nioella sp. MMSF_3534]
MRTLLTALLLSFLSVLPVSAQSNNNPATILVLDASNSMWGQIDGVNKIVIAREVISDLLTQIPDNMELGLTMYGHNRRGDCTDIETMVPPGLNNRDEIARIVNSVNPRGRTPLSDAVIQAAEELRYTENAATVILVSDGRETCDADPCAVGRALEEAGIDFTAHVIGFDVDEPEGIAELQCLAENTGGQFLTASNAEELADALSQVAVAPTPPPMVWTTLRAVVMPGQTAPTSPLIWEIFDENGAVVYDRSQQPMIETILPPGNYQVWLTRVATGTQHGGPITVALPGPQEFIFELPELVPEASLTAPEEAVIGTSVPVGWTGPGAAEDYILLATADRSQSFVQVFPRDGNPLMVTLPDQPGDYLLQYVHPAMNRVLAERSIRALPLPATLEAPLSAVAGSTIEVTWDGPGGENDVIAAVVPSNETNATRAFVREGNPLPLRVPSQAGQYELRYIDGVTQRVLATRILDVTPATATLEAPDTVEIGSTFAVGWTGPGYEPDQIVIAEPGETGTLGRTFVREGNPVSLQAPSEPGIYELRYLMQVDEEVIGTRQIEVTDIVATIEAPATAVAGSTVQVFWTGPDYQSDFIAVGAMAEPDRYTNYAYTRDGSPASLVMPTEPGEYEIRYFLNQNRRVIARHAITVTAVSATLEAPETAVAGSTVQVIWTGPDYQSDFIGVGAMAEPDRYTNYAYTRDGSPAALVMPTEPGDYEIRYFVNQDRTVIARHAITVTDVIATLEAPSTAEAGSTVQVHWTGPDYRNDFIGVGAMDEPDRYSNYAYTRDGSPAALVMPTEPGDYEIRYFVNQDRTVIARHPITVTDVGARLEAPDSAEAGSTVLVTWEGPDYRNDFIAVGAMAEPDRYTNYAYTRDGSPARLLMPTEPGDYEIRYFVNQDRTVIGRHPITVTAVSASIEAPENAAAGDTINVTWTGPDYRNDFIGIGALDDPDGYQNYAYTRDGSPARLEMPVTPGRYEIRYFVNQDRTVIARREIEVTALSVTVTAPETARIGETILVTWDGPDYRNDFIAAAVPSDDGYETYVYTRDGSPARLQMPSEPGSYEIRYYVNQDRSIQARVPITVSDIEVVLDTASSGLAGGSIMVSHNGPDYRNDFIAIARAGEDGHEEYSYTRNGNPLRLDLPEEPGEYEIRYVMNQDRRVLASVPFTVMAP